MSNYSRVFKDEGTLKEMLTLRSKGFHYKTLAFIYGVDHSSIYHLCKKNKIEKMGDITIDMPNIIEVTQSSFVLPVVSLIIHPRKLSYSEYFK